MKRPILKRTVRTVEVVTWTLEYESIPEENLPFSPLHPTSDSLHPPEYVISETEIQLLHKVFQKFQTEFETIAALFYTRLYEIDPSLRRLFKSDMESQGIKLMETLHLIVTGLNTPEKIVPMIRRLGMSHTGYGVRPEHYATVGKALLWAIANNLGQAFNPEVEAAWIRAYGLMSSLMQEENEDTAE